GADHVYSIGGKMFAVAFESKVRGLFVAFKVDDERFLEYTDRPGFVPAPYLARAKWVQVTDMKKINAAELKAMIKRSYHLVALKLTKKRRLELGLADSFLLLYSA
ncbi:MAG: MmcQ/YjbR family DNA-binding protein, partial [Pseudomonadota bacterium]